VLKWIVFHSKHAVGVGCTADVSELLPVSIFKVMILRVGNITYTYTVSLH
jgi:hypothetical protein